MVPEWIDFAFFAMKNMPSVLARIPPTCEIPRSRRRPRQRCRVGFAIFIFRSLPPSRGVFFFWGGGGSSSVDAIVRTSACMYRYIRLVASSVVGGGGGGNQKKRPRH